jgi:hypothetical protein
MAGENSNSETFRRPSVLGGSWAKRVLALVLLASVLTPQPAQANPKLLYSAFEFLGKQLISYGFGKAVDFALGRIFESDLREYEEDLEEKIPGTDGVKKRQLEEELRLVRNQLDVLRKLLQDKVSVQELAVLQRRVQEDVPRIQRLLEQHGQRISGLEGSVGDLRTRLEALEARLSMPTFEKQIALHVGEFSSGSSHLPHRVADGAREVLADELSQDSRVSLTASLAAVDTLIEARVRRYSVDERMFSGYGTRPRLTIFHTLEISLSLLDSAGQRNYFTKVYRRTAREFLPAGSYSSSSDFGVAHELLTSAMRAGAADFSFIFLEPPPPAPPEDVELNR